MVLTAAHSSTPEELQEKARKNRGEVDKKAVGRDSYARKGELRLVLLDASVKLCEGDKFTHFAGRALSGLPNGRGLSEADQNTDWDDLLLSTRLQQIHSDDGSCRPVLGENTPTKGAGAASFMRHSTKPNCKLLHNEEYGYHAEALHDIPGGTELTISYGSKSDALMTATGECCYVLTTGRKWLWTHVNKLVDFAKVSGVPELWDVSEADELRQMTQNLALPAAIVVPRGKASFEMLGAKNASRDASAHDRWTPRRSDSSVTTLYRCPVHGYAYSQSGKRAEHV